jgi:diguanylate cyclase (GGDEF)-like protein
MTHIYVLAEKQVAQLAARTTETVGERYPVHIIDDEPTLLEKLPDSRHAIILAEMEYSRFLPLLQQCRSVLPSTTLIGILPEADVAVPALDMDCHLLAADFTDFDLLSRIASAVRQAELLASMADTSQLDEVSSLFNRRYFMQRVSEDISLSKRHLSPLCVVILSIDYYRMYLDSYGYSFINALLRFLADKVNGMIRHEDIVARLGDDEIAILLPRSTEAGARIFTARLVENLNQLSFQYGAYVEDIAVSAGLVGYPLTDFPQADADTLVRYGRHALHQAKADSEEGAKVCLFSEIRPGF